jgi:hypothetical protein
MLYLWYNPTCHLLWGIRQYKCHAAYEYNGCQNPTVENKIGIIYISIFHHDHQASRLNLPHQWRIGNVTVNSIVCAVRNHGNMRGGGVAGQRQEICRLSPVPSLA